MELKTALFERRSTRSYTNRPVTSEEIRYILKAAVNAPSACNLQSWHFYCVTDPDTRQRFCEFTDDWVATAPVIFVVCTDGRAIEARFGKNENTAKFVLQDTALAMENMLLAAVDIGLGGCILGRYNEEKCREVLNIPAEYKPVALLPIGEPTAKIPPRARKPIDEVTTFIGELTESPAKPEESEQTPYTLRCAWIPKAVFDDVGLPDSTFNNINLQNVRFTDINMENASFGDINLKNSSFGGLTMEGAKFGCVEMNNAEFKNVELRNARFDSCDLRGATVDGVNILDAIGGAEK